ncbi:hypothetical protein L3X38_036167 [Prunus dulcis]|uniref:Uncharacterized protein n=1 Tax=Prunus dulcis TaxID=3755 RepID=A0AAD4V0W7_PRUDU|nr:hypothetical protein L3X38_036167 [Prunus dulcis]
MVALTVTALNMLWNNVLRRMTILTSGKLSRIRKQVMLVRLAMVTRYVALPPLAADMSGALPMSSSTLISPQSRAALGWRKWCHRTGPRFLRAP